MQRGPPVEFPQPAAHPTSPDGNSTSPDGKKRGVSRRTVLKTGGAVAGATTLLGALDLIAWKPLRDTAGAATISDIQHDIGAFIAPAFSMNGVQVQFGP